MKDRKLFGKIGAVATAGVIILTVAGGFLCTKIVPTGYVGVVYSMRGGVKEDVLTQGWRLVSPSEKVSLYSIATEQLYMSADKRDGSKEDESFTIKCNDGTLNVDFEMAYSFEEDKVVDLYSKYRGLSGEEIVNTKIRGKIKTLVSEATSKYSVLDVHLEKVAEVNQAITEHLNNTLSEYGIRVESATLSRTKPSEEVEQAIVNRTKKAQDLEAEKTEQEKIRLEAETAKIKAEGEKERARIEAEAEAEAMKIKAEGEAESNRIISNSITQGLLDKMEQDARLIHGWVVNKGVETVVAK